MIFQYLSILILLSAFVLQLAVDRAPDLPETHDNQAARKVLMAGILVMLMYVGYLSWFGAEANIVPLIGTVLIALAEMAFCINRLFPTVFIHLSERFHRAKEHRHE